MSLFAAAILLARFTVLLNLCDVPFHGLPTLDLPLVFLGSSTAEIIATIPLEPASWILRVYPAFLLPVFEWHGGFDAKAVRFFHMKKPRFGEFVGFIGDVSSIEDAELEHFFGGELRFEFRIEIFTRWTSQQVVAVLEGIVDEDFLGHS